MTDEELDALADEAGELVNKETMEFVYKTSIHPSYAKAAAFAQG